MMIRAQQTGSGGLASDLQENLPKKKQVSEDGIAGPPQIGEENKKLKHFTPVDFLSLNSTMFSPPFSILSFGTSRTRHTNQDLQGC